MAGEIFEMNKAKGEITEFLVRPLRAASLPDARSLLGSRRMNDVTRLLRAAEQGEHDAAERLLNVVYAELHRMAQQKLSRDAGNQTLQPTALVHTRGCNWSGMTFRLGLAIAAHFFGAAALAMRRILIDRARHKLADKWGGGAEHVDLDSVDVAVNADDTTLRYCGLTKPSKSSRKKILLLPNWSGFAFLLALRTTKRPRC
jgi:RNA polymerase sigma factor (TIGR02999 family)